MAYIYLLPWFPGVHVLLGCDPKDAERPRELVHLYAERRPVIDVEAYEVCEVDVRRQLTRLSVRAELEFVEHLLYVLLRRVVAERAHHVRNLRCNLRRKLLLVQA